MEKWLTLWLKTEFCVCASKSFKFYISGIKNSKQINQSVEGILFFILSSSPFYIQS